MGWSFPVSHNNVFNPFSANFSKWSNTLKQFVDNLPRNCLSVFDYFVGLALKGLSAEADFVFQVTLFILDYFIKHVINQSSISMGVLL